MKAAADALKAENWLQSLVDTLTKLDQKLVEDRNTRKCDAEEVARSLKQSSSTVGLTDSSRQAPYARTQAVTSSHNLASSSTAHPPELTDCERKYMETYNGCKKCHGFYMPDGHTCEFPSGDNYIERMMAAVNKGRKCMKLSTMPVPRDEQVTMVAAVSTVPPQPTCPAHR